MDKYRVAAIALSSFSAVETIIALSTASAVGGPLQSSPGGLAGFFWVHSIPLSLAGWTAAGLVTIGSRFSRRSQVKSLFASKGFGGDVYDLMIRMRGRGSRLALLKSLEKPRHRQELAELTGIDWKEVDREISVLEKYGLVKMYAQSGSVKMYQVTEQGRLLMKMIADLQPTEESF